MGDHVAAAGPTVGPATAVAALVTHPLTEALRDRLICDTRIALRGNAHAICSLHPYREKLREGRMDIQKQRGMDREEGNYSETYWQGE